MLRSHAVSERSVPKRYSQYSLDLQGSSDRDLPSCHAHKALKAHQAYLTPNLSLTSPPLLIPKLLLTLSSSSPHHNIPSCPSFPHGGGPANHDSPPIPHPGRSSHPVVNSPRRCSSSRRGANPQQTLHHLLNILEEDDHKHSPHDPGDCASPSEEHRGWSQAQSSPFWGLCIGYTSKIVDGPKHSPHHSEDCAWDPPPQQLAITFRLWSEQPPTRGECDRFLYLPTLCANDDRVATQHNSFAIQPESWMAAGTVLTILRTVLGMTTSTVLIIPRTVLRHPKGWRPITTPSPSK